MHTRLTNKSITAFVNGFTRPSISISTFEFLVPCATLPQTRRSLARHRSSSRYYASECSTSPSINARANGSHTKFPSTVVPSPVHHQKSLGRGAQVQVKGTRVAVAHLGKQEDVKRLVEELDPYLPLELRSKSWLENLAAFEGVRSIQTLPSLLLKAKSTIPRGLLHYISIEQDRLDCLVYLTKCLFRARPREEIDPFYLLYQDSPWSKFLKNQSLSTATNHAITISSSDHQPADGPEVRLLPAPAGGDSCQCSSKDFQDLIGEIWECLGDLIITATKADDDKSRGLMQYVHWILADMHSQDIISSSIYQFDPNVVPCVRRKSPYLHAMSSRIMTVISDSMWRAEEHDIIEHSRLTAATYASRGQEPPGTELRPHVRPLLPSTWLEFVLWSCVHGSHFREASRLICRIKLGRQRSRWSLIGWKELQKTALEKMSAKGQNLSRSWLDRIAGAFEGYSEEPSIIEMPHNCISSEVVAATLHGLFSDLERDVGPTLGIADTFSAYKQSLPNGMSNRQQLFRNNLLSRCIDQLAAPMAAKSGFVSPETPEGLLESQNEHLPSSSGAVGMVADDFFDCLYDPTHNLLLTCFEDCVFRRDLNNSLTALRHLQAWTDTNKTRRLKSFSPDTDGIRNGSPLSYIGLPENVQTQISDPIKAAFLELVVNGRLFSLARWLLYSGDVDIEQPMIPSHAYRSSIYQPALLRYATALSDHEILIKITQELNNNLETVSSETLQALLACQISLNRWANARELLCYMRDVRGMHPGPKEVTALACKIIRPEPKPVFARLGGDVDLGELQKLLKILLLRGFMPRRNPSEPKDYTHIRELNTLSRIFSTLGGELGGLASDCVVERGPASAPVTIPTNAFNDLLAKVVEVQGSSAARSLFDRWCRFPVSLPHALSQSPKRNLSRFGRQSIQTRTRDEEDKVVTPNLDTVRIILAEAMKEFPEFRGLKVSFSALAPQTDILSLLLEDDEQITVSDRSSEDGDSLHMPAEVSTKTKELLQWGLRTFRRMGLDDAAINAEVQGALEDS